MIKYQWFTLVACLAGMLDKQTQFAIEYLREENKILREKLGQKRLILNKFQKLRLAIKAKALHKNVLADVGTLFSPDTLLRW